ncbi:hemolysin family protein, partial [Desulfovibrio sp. OttesenSCG-928-O18]|nr:hemolysin family protein [Desulfovibrio sp. OttesenSCG-928-O18]
MYTGLMLFVAFCLVVLNGLFVAAEFSFVKARRTKLELLAEEGSRRAKTALFGIHNLDAYLSVCQLGITLASLGLGWLGEPAVAALLRPVLAVVGVTSASVVSSLSVAVGFTLITLVHVVFGELVPKSISIQKAEETVMLLAVPMRIFYVLWYPVVTVMNGISNFFLHLAGLHTASESEQSHSPEELRMLIMDSSREGQLEESEGRMLGNIFSFYKKMAKDIMVHRMDVSALDVAEGLDGAVALATASGHTRFPVYENSRDNIIGFIHAKDLLHLKNTANVRDIMREPLYAYETVHLDRLLELMQNKRQQFCVVVDEYGLWQGVITMEDIMEAIVGDIQ